MTRIILAVLIGFLAVSCQMPTGPRPTFPVTLVSGIGRTDVRWEPVSGADRYRVSWTAGPSSAGGSLETSSGSAIADDLVPGVDYTFTVTALAGGALVARAEKPWRSEGWTWVADPVVLQSVVKTDAKGYDLGDGNYVIFLSTTTITTERLERLNYGAGGVARSTWFRLTTKTAEGGPTVELRPETTVVGVWVEPWVEFSAGGTARTAFSPGRTTFTLEGAPDVVWRCTR